MRFCLFLLLILHANGVLAEGGTCPEGYYPVNSPGVMGCAPIPGYGGDNEPVDPGPQWVTRWGATALGGGGFGAVANFDSKRKAIKAAKKKCLASNAGKGCDDVQAYYNQCVAMAGGSSIATGYHAPDLDMAQRMALKECARSDINCRVFYSACSYPVRIR